MLQDSRLCAFLLLIGLFLARPATAGAQQPVTIPVEFHLEIRWLVRRYQAQGEDALEAAQLNAAEKIVERLQREDVKEHLPWQFEAAATNTGSEPRFEVALLQDPRSRQGQLEMDIRAFGKDGKGCVFGQSLRKPVRLPIAFPTPENSIGIQNLSERTVEYFEAAYIESEEIATKAVCERVKVIPIGRLVMNLPGWQRRGVLMLNWDDYQQWGLSQFDITCSRATSTQPAVQLTSQGINEHRPWQYGSASGRGILVEHKVWNNQDLDDSPQEFSLLEPVGEVRLREYVQVHPTPSDIKPSK